MVLLHIIFPQELFGLALQPPKQPNKMLTSRVCSDTSSIWCESVGIPRSHSSGSSWFVIWKKNCLNLSSKKQKLNSLGDVNCDVAMLHLNFIQLREQLLHALFKKNLFTLTSCSTEESTVWNLNLVSASVGLTKKSLPWLLGLGLTSP